MCAASKIFKDNKFSLFYISEYAIEEKEKTFFFVGMTNLVVLKPWFNSCRLTNMYNIRCIVKILVNSHMQKIFTKLPMISK